MKPQANENGGRTAQGAVRADVAQAEMKTPSPVNLSALRAEDDVHCWATCAKMFSAAHELKRMLGNRWTAEKADRGFRMDADPRNAVETAHAFFNVACFASGARCRGEGLPDETAWLLNAAADAAAKGLFESNYPEQAGLAHCCFDNAAVRALRAAECLRGETDGGGEWQWQ